MTTEVPYRARLRAHFGDGGTKERDIQGTYVETLLSDVEVKERAGKGLVRIFVAVASAAVVVVVLLCLCC